MPKFTEFAVVGPNGQPYFGWPILKLTLLAVSALLWRELVKIEEMVDLLPQAIRELKENTLKIDQHTKDLLLHGDELKSHGEKIKRMEESLIRAKLIFIYTNISMPINKEIDYAKARHNHSAY